MPVETSFEIAHQAESKQGDSIREAAMPTLPIELAELLRYSEGKPVSVIDPKTGMEFVIVPAADYARLANSLPHAELTHDEQDYLLQQAGRLAGWDDSEMDVYNELDPRKTA